MRQIHKTLLGIVLLLLINCNTNNSPKNVSDLKEKEALAEINGDHPNSEVKFPDLKDLEQYRRTQFVPTIESSFNQDKNAIYCVTMLYAWDAVRELLSSPMEFKNATGDMKLLNSSKSFRKTLDTTDYKITAEIDGFNIRTEARFNKSLPFDHAMSTFEHKDNLVFDNKRVVSFGAEGRDREAAWALDILYYKDDNNFVIKLAFRDTLHEIILYKSENSYSSMDRIISEISTLKKLGETERKVKKKSWRYSFKEIDQLVIPKFRFNIENNYKNVEGQSFISNNMPYTIKKAWQQIAFVLDEGGAGVGSDAATWMEAAMMPDDPEKPRPKLMRFDKPFFVMLKKTASEYPYFAMWTNNTELMILD